MSLNIENFSENIHKDFEVFFEVQNIDFFTSGGGGGGGEGAVKCSGGFLTPSSEEEPLPLFMALLLLMTPLAL